MKHFRRRRSNDDRHLKLMARTDQMKADQYRGEPLASSSLNAFAVSATQSNSRVPTNGIRPSRTLSDQGWLDSSGVG